MASTKDKYQIRRDEAVAATAEAIKRSKTADRQSKIRARRMCEKKDGWKDLSPGEQARLKELAEARNAERRNTLRIDSDSRLTGILDIEDAAIAAINAEENEEKRAILATAKGETITRAKKDKNREFKDVWAGNMIPVIEAIERRIVASGTMTDPEITDEEMKEFLAGVSNPQGVQAYLDRWNNPDADLNEGLGEEFGAEVDGEEDIEVVVSDSEDVITRGNFFDEFVVDVLAGLDEFSDDDEEEDFVVGMDESSDEDSEEDSEEDDVDMNVDDE
ncbi:hypothetical protein O988_01069 [Pseudogymnoascus sp. VKM F-3808]|nr:hypothetical protein O988_01069 [Pseudogymnoascus sp. VKM F-3808]